MLRTSLSAFDPERTFAFVDVSNIAQTPLRQGAQAVVAGIISIADTPPKFDPAPACKAAAAIDQSMDLAVSQSYESCMNDEESARAELVKGWNTYPADAKPRCVGEATDGGLPSYVELLECFLVTVNVGGNDPVTPPQGNKKKNQKTR